MIHNSESSLSLRRGKSRHQLNITRLLPRPNEYTLALDNEYAHVAFNEERTPLNKGLWREKVFSCPEQAHLDLEIGTGNGTFFAHQSALYPERFLVGMEIKYKPLIQTIRRALKQGSRNVAVCRYHAFNVDLAFSQEEIDDVYIHFPDPWVTPRKPKNRTVNADFLKVMHGLQRPGSRIFFKTDSREYFDWSLDEIKNSPYELIFKTFDLHQSERAGNNYQTAFEKIFMRQGILINYLELRK